MGNYPDILLLALLGLVIGSFLNVCIYRLPRNESIIRPGSSCPDCKKKLAWWHKIPLLSYIILFGRCNYCHSPISKSYFFVEVLTAICFAVLFTKFGISVQFFVYSVFISLMIVIAIIDLKYYVILDIMTISGIVFGFITALLQVQIISPIDSIIGLVSGILTLYLIRIIGNKLMRKESMGLGDIKLAGLIGVFLGWQLILLSLFLSSLMISLIHLFQLMMSKSKVNKQYPLGFYFSTGAIICLFFGKEIIDMYVMYIL